MSFPGSGQHLAGKVKEKKKKKERKRIKEKKKRKKEMKKKKKEKKGGGIPQKEACFPASISFLYYVN